MEVCPKKEGEPRLIWSILYFVLLRVKLFFIEVQYGIRYNTYKISYNRGLDEQTCILPLNKLHAEFIIWHQERLNQLYKVIKKIEADFDRLGIKWI